MSAVLKFEQQLVMEICCNCGIAFAMPFEIQRRAKREGKTFEFYCPAGHPQFYSIGEIEKLKKQLEDEREQHRQRLEFERRQTELARRELVVTKGQLTKTKKRIANGVCPCCHRSFAALQRHMKTKHPDYQA